jgi:beta-glucosidase
MSQDALYPFGYGLSYTKFEMSNASVDTDEIGLSKAITCSVDLKNVGNYAGAETVQVYVRAKVEGAPNHQLKGLKKVNLMPGEQKTIKITLNNEAFGLYDNNGKLVLHEGEFEVFIGNSQPDVRSIQLTGNKPFSKIVRSPKTVIL